MIRRWTQIDADERRDIKCETRERLILPVGIEEDIEIKKQISTYPLRLPASLKKAVAELSKEDGTSINQFVVTAVAEKVSAMRIAEFFAARGAGADIEAARCIIRRAGGQPPEPNDRLP